MIAKAPLPNTTPTEAMETSLKIFETSITSTFSTIELTVTVLSGLIVIIAFGLSFILGRSAKETQAAANAQLGQIANLYKQNIDTLSSNLQTQAAEAISKALNLESVDAMLAAYREKFNQLSDEVNSVESVVDRYLLFRDATESFSEDYVGVFLSAERTIKSLAKSPEKDKPEIRLQLQQALIAIQRGGLLRRLSANRVFNVAQVAAQYSFSDLAHRLAVVAKWLNNTPLYEMRVYRSEFEMGQRYSVVLNSETSLFEIRDENPTNASELAQQFRSEALQKAIDAIKTVDTRRDYLVLAEVWNILLHADQEMDFIKLMEDRAFGKEHSEFSSYFFAILAQAYAVASPDDWKENFSRHLQVSLSRIRTESRRAPWFDSTSEKIELLLADIAGEPRPGSVEE